MPTTGNLVESVWTYLDHAPLEYVSGQTIAQGTGRSRVAIWKAIHALQRLGYRIEARPALGYRLVAAPNRPFPWEIRKRLPAPERIQRIEFFDRLPSTQETASQLAEAGADQGTVVVAESQGRGRGRLGRTWVSPLGGLWMSIIVRPTVPSPQLILLQLTAAVAVVQALRKTLGVSVWIKWPNDVCLGGRKICGILVEAALEPDRIRHAIVGIGLNANFPRISLPAELRSVATSLREELDREVLLAPLAAAVLREFRAWYALLQQRPLVVLREVRRHARLLGHVIRVDQAGTRFEGRALALDGLGQLIVERADGSRVVVGTGDVSVLP